MEDGMNLILRYFLVMIFATLFSGLSSCGGGGGGGDGGGVAVNYDGISTPVQFTNQNATVIGERFEEIGDPLQLLDNPFMELKAPASSLSSLNRFALLRKPGKILPMASEPGSCGGSISVTETSSSITVRFNRYCDAEGTGGDTVDGYLSGTGRESVVNGNYAFDGTATFDVTTTRGLNQLVVVRGTVKISERGVDAWYDDSEGWYVFTPTNDTYLYNLLIGDATLGYTVWFSNYVNYITYDEDGWEDEVSVSGRIYFNDYGYFDVSTTVPVDLSGAYGELFLNGSSGSAIKLIQSPTYVWTAYIIGGGQVPGGADYDFGQTYIQYRTKDSPSLNKYYVWVSLTKDGVGIAAEDVVDIDFLNTGSGVQLQEPSNFNPITYYYYNCAEGSCVQSGPLTENGYWQEYTSIAAGNYAFNVYTADMQVLTKQVTFSGQLALPVVDDATMVSTWQETDLRLDWSNPTGAGNWSSVSQYRIVVFDSEFRSILFARVPLNATSITLPGALLDEARALGNGTISRWQIQTRAYDSNNMNYARGVSLQMLIP